MLLLESQHLLNLLIAQRRLPLIQFSRDRRVRRMLLKELLRRRRRGNGIICRIKHLKTQPILLHTKIADLPQIPRINITPRIPLTHRRIINVRREVARILMRLNHVTNAQGIDVSVEAARKAAGHALAAEFGNRVCVHGVYVVGFVEWKGGVVERALAETDFVGGFGGGDDDFLDAEFTGGFDDVVGAGYVAAVAFIVLGRVSMGCGKVEGGSRTGTSMLRA
jgi:hypothetical protein